MAESAHDPDGIGYIKVTDNDFVLAGAGSQGGRLRFTDFDMPVATRMPATRAGPEFVARRVYPTLFNKMKYGFTFGCPGCTWWQN